MVRKVYELSSSKKLTLEYNPRHKDLAVRINETVVTQVEHPPGLGSWFMFSEEDLFRVITISGEDIGERLEVFFNRCELYTTAELYIDGKSAENQERTLPTSYTGFKAWNAAMWIMFILFFVFVLVAMVLTMIIGFIVLVICIVIYLLYWQHANGKTYTYDVKHRVSSV